MAYVTTAILAIGALVAYFQWRTAHQRVVLDLFERRLAIFSDIESAARAMLNATSREERAPPFWRYIGAEAKARFLFGEDISKLLEELRADLAAIKAFGDIDFDNPKYADAVDRMQQAEFNIAEFLQKSEKPFAPYMRLDQKMPSLWWPTFLKC